jgi:hypothetical protein
LQGYWDLVTPEIAKLEGQFEELVVLESNGWVKPEPEKKKPAKKIVKRAAAAGPVKKPVAKQSSNFRAFLAQKTKQTEGGSSLQGPSKTAEAAAKETGKFNYLIAQFQQLRIKLSYQVLPALSSFFCWELRTSSAEFCLPLVLSKVEIRDMSQNEMPQGASYFK